MLDEAKTSLSPIFPQRRDYRLGCRQGEAKRRLIGRLLVLLALSDDQLAVLCDWVNRRTVNRSWC